jgi:hypothetical protein
MCGLNVVLRGVRCDLAAAGLLLGGNIKECSAM